MTTLGLLLKPLDVLLFRDARPFEAGDTGRTQWPTPATFAGLIKSHITRSFLNAESARWHGHHGKAPVEQPWHVRVKLRGPWLYVAEPGAVQDWNARTGRTVNAVEGPLTAAPADLVRLGKHADAKLARLRPLESPELPGWRPPCPGMRPMWLAPKVDAAKSEPAAGWLDARGLKRHLAGDDLNVADIHSPDAVAVREDRTGIGVDAERLTADQEQGLIYSASFLRLAPGVCFYGEVDWPDDAPRAPALDDVFPLGLVLPWGGERRGVIVERTTSFDWKSIEPTEANGNLLTLLVTPGVFSNGEHRWKPVEQGTLRAACVPKPLPVSGWDLAGVAENDHQPRPRPTRFAVPAGTVYLWSRGKRNADTPIAAGLRSLCDKPQDADNGWGLALSGIWKPCALD